MSAEDVNELNAAISGWVTATRSRLDGARHLGEVRRDMARLLTMTDALLQSARNSRDEEARMREQAEQKPDPSPIRARFVALADACSDSADELELVIAHELGVPRSHSDTHTTARRP